MEVWLSLDLSSATGSLALHRVGGDGTPALLREEVIDPFRHSEKVIVGLQRALLAEELVLPSISRFITTIGPGSFTGLRIAFSTLKAFALALDRPIDTLSGSEARARAWLKEHPQPPGSRLSVFTHLSLEKYAKAEFSLQENGRLCLEAETLVIGEGDEGVKTTFPLSARLLAEALPYATTRRTHTTPQEWIALSPEYFGSTRF